MPLIWIFLIPAIVVICGMILTEKGGGTPYWISNLANVDSRLIWNAGIVFMAVIIIIKYLKGN